VHQRTNWWLLARWSVTNSAFGDDDLLQFFCAKTFHNLEPRATEQEGTDAPTTEPHRATFAPRNSHFTLLPVAPLLPASTHTRHTPATGSSSYVQGTKEQDWVHCVKRCCVPWRPNGWTESDQLIHIKHVDLVKRARDLTEKSRTCN
jgi:hypothetical protein